ncbi:uncharacterized protein [Rutidosis leptorrhynchoides]|uniref:uncharacterized protein n=1 Tax=Rutidosis leptorrhynchoides TaxID=125765 RepID=UPI003A98F44B
MYRDAAEVIRKCQSCQLHAPVSKAPRHPMIPVASPWPFCKWAIDIVGPFPTGPGGIKFLFEGNPFSDWCQELNIKQTFTSVAHPQANGQCEVTNRDIVLGIKARLGLCRRGWIDELPNVLWAHRTTPKGTTNETPFSLVYGSEAVIPAEINVPTMRIASFDESSNSEELRENLNLVEDRREMAAIKENEASRAEDTGKLGPEWEGPYKVIGISDTEAYRLASLDGKAIKCTCSKTSVCFKRSYDTQDGDLHSLDYKTQVWFTCLNNQDIGVVERLLSIDIGLSIVRRKNKKIMKRLKGRSLHEFMLEDIKSNA